MSLRETRRSGRDRAALLHVACHSYANPSDQQPSCAGSRKRRVMMAVDALTTTVAADDPLLSAEEVSAMLGGVPVGTLKRWRTERNGPVALHIGRHVRYRRSAVEEWLRQKDREAADWMRG